MPNPNFIPIIGSSFDQLGNQQLAWAGFNKNVEEGNIQRAMTAQQLQNNWLAQVADANQRREEENLMMQLKADTDERAYAERLSGEKVRQRERAEDVTRSSKQFEQQLKFGSDQLTSQQKIAEDKIAATTKNELLRTEAHGQTLASNYGVAKKNADLAAAALEGLQRAQDADEAEIEKTDSKRDAQKYLLLKNRITSRKTDIRNAQTAATHTSNALDKLELSATNGGFEIREDGSIIHADSGKKWTWKNALRDAQTNTVPLGPPAPTGPAPTEGVPWSNVASTFGRAAMIGASPIGSIWPGFTQGTGTTPAPAAPPPITPANIPAVPITPPLAAPTPLRIGRYTVTPIEE